MKSLLKHGWPCVLLTLVMFLSASCNLPAQSNDIAPGTHAWIDAPLNNSVLPLAPANIISHATDPNSITDVELSVDNTVIRTDQNQDYSQKLVTMSQPWVPAAPGVYTIQVRVKSTSGAWSDYAVVTVTVEGGPTITPTLVVSPTPVNSSTPTLVPSATASPTAVTPTFTLNENAFCRKGPDVSFTDVTAVTKGETVDIQGVSEDGNWYFVFWKKFNAKCWVAAPTGQVNGNVQGVPVLVSPDTPTPSPLPRVSPTSGGKP